MKNIRVMLSSLLLVSALVLLSGCDLFKPVSCPSCKPTEERPAAAPEDVLLTIDGRPAITMQKFEDFYELALASAGQFGAPSKREVFKQVEAMVILDHHMEQSGKDRTEEYQKELKRAYDHARWGINTQMLAKELSEQIDVSETALAKFYGEQIGTNPAFDRPPFIKSPESITVESVEFGNKADAETFLAKAKTNFAAAAAEAGLTVKNLGAVSSQSQNVDVAIRLKAGSSKPGDVQLAQAAEDKFYVIKSGNKVKAQYATFSEIKAMPQMLDMLGQFKKQSELEQAFLNRIEEYRKGLTLVPNEEYFKADDERLKAEQEQLMKLFQEQMANQEPQSGGVVAA